MKNYKIIVSPVGPLTIVTSEQGLCGIYWKDDERLKERELYKSYENHPMLLEIEKQLESYFAQKRTAFSLALDMEGTPFEKRVWEALLTIPYGETRTYGYLAKFLNVPKAARAVGRALGRNPISIVVPCHRVIGSSGKLVGFAGGLAAKKHLLKLETEHKKDL